MSDQPKFSKAAEKRVKDRLPIPEVCPHCGGAVKFANNAEIYGRPYGDWPWMYRCQKASCGAYVGTHPQTNLPLGTLATKKIREARKLAKEQFNKLWQGGRMTRSDAYAWLATRMNIPVAACHFGWFDEAQCEKAIEALKEPAAKPVKTAAAVKAFADLRAILHKPVAARS